MGEQTTKIFNAGVAQGQTELIEKLVCNIWPKLKNIDNIAEMLLVSNETVEDIIKKYNLNKL